MADDNREEPGPRLEAVRVALGVSMDATWLGYFEVGGDGSPGDLRLWLQGAVALPIRDHDFIAQALNDLAIEHGGDHPAPYRGL